MRRGSGGSRRRRGYPPGRAQLAAPGVLAKGVIHMPALKQLNAGGSAEADRGAAVGAGQDQPGGADALDSRRQPCFVLGHRGRRRSQRDRRIVEAQAAPIDRRCQAHIRAGETDAIPSLSCEPACEAGVLDVVEDIGNVDLKDNGVAPRPEHVGVETAERVGHQGRERQRQGDRTRRREGVIRAALQSQQPAVDALADVAGDGATGGDIARRQQRDREIGQRYREAGEHRKRWRVAREATDRPPSDEAGDIDLHQGAVQLRQQRRRHRPLPAGGTALVRCRPCLDRVPISAAAARPARRPDDVDDRTEVGGGEDAGEAVTGRRRPQERIIGKKHGQPVQFALHPLLRRLREEEQQIAVAEAEELTLVVRREAGEAVGGEAKVMLAPMQRAQSRQRHMRCRPSFATGVQVAEVVEQQLIVGERGAAAGNDGAERPGHAQSHPFASIAATSSSMKRP